MKTSIQAYSNRKFRLSCYNRNRNTDKAGTSTKLIYTDEKIDYPNEILIMKDTTNYIYV